MQDRIKAMEATLHQVMQLIEDCQITVRAMADAYIPPEPEPVAETVVDTEPDEPGGVDTEADDFGSDESSGAVDSPLPNRGHETEGGGTCTHCGANLGDWSSVDCVARDV